MLEVYLVLQQLNYSLNARQWLLPTNGENWSNLPANRRTWVDVAVECGLTERLKTFVQLSDWRTFNFIEQRIGLSSASMDSNIHMKDSNRDWERLSLRRAEDCRTIELVHLGCDRKQLSYPWSAKSSFPRARQTEDFRLTGIMYECSMKLCAGQKLNMDKSHALSNDGSPRERASIHLKAR